jgi:hypothetical protein
MTQQLDAQDTRDVEIIADVTGIPADVVIELAEESALEDGLTVSEELDAAAEELSEVDSGDDDTVWGMTNEA